MNPEYKLAQAKLALIHKWPYYAAALMALVHVSEPSVKTMAVDKKWRLYYAPKFVMEVPVLEVVGILLHEVEHLLRKHADRKVWRDHYLWNVACDLEINDDVEQFGFRLPEYALRALDYTKLNSAMVKGRVAEQYYEIINSDERLKRQFVQQLRIVVGAKPLAGSGGSSADGERKEWEIADSDDGSSQGVDSADAEIIFRRVAEDVLGELAKGRGNIPGHLKRWAEELLKPKVDWRRELRSTLSSSVSRASGKDNYTYARPNRRQDSYGSVIVPSMSRSMIRLAIVIDTSGSMSQVELAQGIAEVNGVLRSFSGGIDVYVISCDAGASSAQKINSAKSISLVGGGGTDMRVGIKGALEIKPEVSIIVVFTDGETPWPSSSPKTKVIAVITKNSPNPPSFIKAIRICS